MQVETIPVTEPKRPRKHEFHTISTSKNISKEKFDYINKEFDNDNFKSDIKTNLKTNNSPFKTKKVKNSLNSILFTTLLPTSLVYPNVLDYICNNTNTKNDGLKKKNSKKNKKFWTTIRKKKISELNLDDKIIGSSLLSPNYYSSPPTPNGGDNHLNDLIGSNTNDNKDTKPQQQTSSQTQSQIQSQTKLQPQLQQEQKQDKEKEQKSDISSPSSKPKNKESSTKNIPNNTSNHLEIPKDNIPNNNTKRSHKINSNSVSALDDTKSLNKNEHSMFRSAENVLNDNNKTKKKPLPMLSVEVLDDSALSKKSNVRNSKDIRNKTFNVASMRKNMSNSITYINTDIHSSNKVYYSSYTNLMNDEDKQSILYNISPTLTHGELHKKLDSQFPSLSEQFSSLKNTYIVTRHNSMDVRKENKRNSLLKKSNESINSSSHKILPNSKRTSTDQLGHSNIINTSISNNNHSNNESSSDINVNSFPNLNTLKNIGSNNLKSSSKESELISENSINTITKSNYNNYISEDTNKEISKLKNLIGSVDKFLSVDTMENANNNEIQSQYFDVKSINNGKQKSGSSLGSISSVTAAANRKSKVISESKIKNATTISD